MVGVVLLGGLGAREVAPRRNYHLEFERAAESRALESAPKEQLASLEPEHLAESNLDSDALLSPVRVVPRPDPEALVEAPREVVPDLVAELWKNSGEVVFGFVEPGPKSTPELAPPVLDEVAPTAPDPEPAADASHAPSRREGTDPDYPRASVRLGEEGDVVLRLAIAADGRVTLVELETSSGFRRLDQAAMSAAPTWAFEVPPSGPPKSFLHTVHFRLQRQ